MIGKVRQMLRVVCEKGRGKFLTVDLTEKDPWVCLNAGTFPFSLSFGVDHNDALVQCFPRFVVKVH